MSIETYNRMRNVSHMTVSHNYSITGGRNEELIDRLLNIRAFINPVRKQVKLLISKTINP